MPEQLLSKELRVHWSKTPITQYTQSSQKYYTAKPRGLWYSINNSWIRHASCGYYEIPYKLKILSKNILLISSFNNVKEFVNQYSIPYQWGLRTIDWIQVSKDYDGIEINPYEKYHEDRNVNYRLFLITQEWYSFWDVAGGCLWGQDACSLEEISLDQ